ncbi:hypothetical protein CG775_21760 [Paenibacillus polymyxa]|nr:hypothetical protein CG775_21760 [Paenibacillus polymyxa]
MENQIRNEPQLFSLGNKVGQCAGLFEFLQYLIGAVFMKKSPKAGNVCFVMTSTRTRNIQQWAHPFAIHVGM